MTRTTRHNNGSAETGKKRHDRSQARKLVKDFERQYIARNQDPHIYL